MKLTEWEKHNLKLSIKQLWIKMEKEVTLLQEDELKRFEQRFHKKLQRTIKPYKKLISYKLMKGKKNE